jgi:hypothetical protein
MSALPYMVREFTEADYPLLEQWWSVHKSQSPTPPAAMLPKIGLLATRQEDGVPDACAFLILADNAPMSILEFPASRPGIGLERARAAFSAIVCVLKQTAAEYGRTYMLAYTMPAIARELRAHGFQEGNRKLVMTVALTS